MPTKTHLLTGFICATGVTLFTKEIRNYSQSAWSWPLVPEATYDNSLGRFQVALSQILKLFFWPMQNKIFMQSCQVVFSDGALLKVLPANTSTGCQWENIFYSLILPAICEWRGPQTEHFCLH